MWEAQVQSLGGADPLEKEMAPHSSILAWEIPWAEELCGLQSMGYSPCGLQVQRIRHDCPPHPHPATHTQDLVKSI